VVWFVEVDHRVRKVARQMPPGWRIELPEARRSCLNLGNHPLDLIVKPPAQILTALGIVEGRLRMENVRLHRPTMRRTFAAVCSPGMPSTAPLRISSIRR